MVFWRLIDNEIKPTELVQRLGFPIGTEIYDLDTINNIEEIPLYRTCHAFGDWAIISAFPRLIKKKYPNKKVLIPSPALIEKMFYPLKEQWKQWENPWNNARVVFENNPYIDGEFDSFEGEVLSDHYRIYNLDNLKEPLIKQMLRVYGFEENELIDTSPEIYFSEEEISEGEKLIKDIESYCSLIITQKHKFSSKDDELINIINQYKDNLFLYWSAFPIESTPYNFIKNKIDINTLTKNLRVQLYIRSKAKANFGTQTGVTDVMERYTPVYVIAHENYDFTLGDYLNKINYI